MNLDALVRLLDEAALLSDDVAVAVAVRAPATGTLRWAGGGGRLPWADARTPFYAASVTKQLVGVLTAQEVLAGRLDPEHPVIEHVPQLPGWARGIRVRHLLHHTSGLPPNPWRLGVAGSPADLTNAAVVHALEDLPEPEGPPGRAFAYTNTGYVLLAEVVASVARTPLPKLAEQRVFGPLGLADSGLGDVPAGTPAEVRPPGTLGDGGWWTSAGDLLVWLAALNADVFGAGVSRLVQAPGRLDDGTLLDYGWGVTVRPDPGGVILTHGGDWPGWTAKTVRQPATGTAVALLSTSDDVPGVSEAAMTLHRRLQPRRVQRGSDAEAG